MPCICAPIVSLDSLFSKLSMCPLSPSPPLCFRVDFVASCPPRSSIFSRWPSHNLDTCLAELIPPLIRGSLPQRGSWVRACQCTSGNRLLDHDFRRGSYPFPGG